MSVIKYQSEYQREMNLSSSIFRRRISRDGNEGEVETRDFQDRFRFIIPAYLRYTSIHANLSICLQPFRHNRSASFWLSSVSFMPRSLGDAIRKGKKIRSHRRSHVMSMNFYIEILSPRVPGKGKIKEEICGAIMTFATATRGCARWPIHSFISSLSRSIFLLKRSILSLLLSASISSLSLFLSSFHFI